MNFTRNYVFSVVFFYHLGYEEIRLVFMAV